MKQRRIPGLIFLFGFAFVLGCGPSSENGTAETPAEPLTTFITIGTGGINDMDFIIGGTIAKMANRKKDQPHLRYTVEPTDGSVFNVNAVLSGDLQFGLVPSDRQYLAINGLAEWKDKGKQEDLRACFAIPSKSITLVAAVDTGITDIVDLKGKRVGIGISGSSQHRNALDALKAVGLNEQTNISAEAITSVKASDFLQANRIDAFFDTVRHPNGVITRVTSGARAVRFVSISCVEQLMAIFPCYAKDKIPVRLYPRSKNTSDVDTFSVKATLVTSTKVPDDIVYTLVKAAFENLDEFKKLHRAHTVLTKEKMLEGLSAPFHMGAMKYYKESGLK